MQPLPSGAVEHYATPALYDLRYAGRREDVDYYAKRAAQWPTILEWGAGSGRLTFAMAGAGADVLAVDTSPEMLAQLKLGLKAEPKLKNKIRTHCADMRNYRPKRKFSAVVAGFSTFCHLYHHDDVSRVLRLAYDLLLPGGDLVFDLPSPRIDAEGYDHFAQIFVSEIQLPPEGSKERFVANQTGARGQLLTQRIFHLQEMKMHLSYSGFENVEVIGDFRPKKPDVDAQTLVFTARRPTSVE